LHARQPPAGRDHDHRWRTVAWRWQQRGFTCGWPPPGKRKCSVPHRSRLQSCVRPVHAARMDCWPWWSPRTGPSTPSFDHLVGAGE